MTVAEEPRQPTTTTALDPTLGSLPRGLNVLLTAAAVIIVIAGLRSFSSSVGPIFLALVIMVVVYPLQDALLDRGTPPWLAMLALMGTSFGVLGIIVASLIWSASELVGLVTSDEYTDQLASTQTEVSERLDDIGVSGDNLDSVVEGLDLGAVAGQVTSALSGVLGVASATSLLMITMLFMALDSHKFGLSFDAVAKSRPDVTSALSGFASRTRSYFIVSTVFGLIVAVLDVGALMLLDIPLPLVWGVLSLITNYIPNIGFVVGLMPPAILALFNGGWEKAAWVIVIYLVINIVIQSVIQPKFVGDAVGLSTTLTFISLIFWGWVLGPLGALLAVPMTLLAKSLLIDIDPSTRWVGPLIALDSPEPTPALSDLAGGSDKDPLADSNELAASKDAAADIDNAAAPAKEPDES